MSMREDIEARHHWGLSPTRGKNPDAYTPANAKTLLDQLAGLQATDPLMMERLLTLCGPWLQNLMTPPRKEPPTEMLYKIVLRHLEAMGLDRTAYAAPLYTAPQPVAATPAAGSDDDDTDGEERTTRTNFEVPLTPEQIRVANLKKIPPLPVYTGKVVVPADDDTSDEAETFRAISAIAQSGSKTTRRAFGAVVKAVARMPIARLTDVMEERGALARGNGNTAQLMQKRLRGESRFSDHELAAMLECQHINPADFLDAVRTGTGKD